MQSQISSYSLLTGVLVPFMLKCWKRVQEGLPLSEVAFVGLSQRFPTMIGIWALQEADAQSKRWENPEAMDIYETKTKKGEHTCLCSI